MQPRRHEGTNNILFSSCFRAFVAAPFMQYEFLTTRREGPVEYLTLNRPDVRNAFNEHVIRELTDWSASVPAEVTRSGLRAIVLSGAGKAFSAGADAEWMVKTVSYSEDENLRDATATVHLFSQLDQLP